MRGEELKIQQAKIQEKYDLQRLHKGVRDVHTNCQIIKWCQFSGELYKHKIHKAWDRTLIACVGYAIENREKFKTVKQKDFQLLTDINILNLFH